MDQIAMGGMQLDDVETRLIGARGRLAPGFDRIGNFMTFERARRHVAAAERKRAWTDQVPALHVLDRCELLLRQRAIALPGTPRFSFPAGVSELDAGHRAVRLDEAGDL